MSLYFQPDIKLSTCHLTIKAKFERMLSPFLMGVGARLREAQIYHMASVWGEARIAVSSVYTTAQFETTMLTRLCLVSEKGVGIGNSSVHKVVSV